ncbi:septum formation initiator [Micromonospora sp. RTGN7]|uniref:septum formation initiator n=1 Tax=Micromonospora sp. RTGN7 TaxID=3016526 RepID=UPI0029FF4087|nr:septum formation initiator [Micromonospora sp. RTGN7]
MRRRRLLAFAGWLATAVLATLVGVAAIRLVGESITGTPGGVHSQDDVERVLASPEATPTTPGGTPSTGPGASSPMASPGGGAPRAFVSVGGSAVAECTPGGVRLVSWAPAQGYRVGDADRGPDDDVEVTFVGPGGEHELRLRCVAGQPMAVADD